MSREPNPAPAGLPTASAPPRPGMVVTLIVSQAEGGGLVLEGIGPEDAELVRRLSVSEGPTDLWRLVVGARAAGYAVLIRSDLPPIH